MLEKYTSWVPQRVCVTAGNLTKVILTNGRNVYIWVPPQTDLTAGNLTKIILTNVRKVYVLGTSTNMCDSGKPY